MSRGHFCLGATVALAVLVTSAPGFAQEARSTCKRNHYRPVRFRHRGRATALD